MKGGSLRGSLRRRLLWGRRSHNVNLAMLGVALLSLLVLSSLLLAPQLLTSHNGSAAHQASKISGGDPIQISDENISDGEVLRIASVQPSLSAVVSTSVHLGETSTDIQLINTGNGVLSNARVTDAGGKALGSISQLAPGERKVLTVFGNAGRINVAAADSDGNTVEGSVTYDKSLATGSSLPPEMPTSSISAPMSVPDQSITKLETKAAGSENGLPQTVVEGSMPVPASDKAGSGQNRSIGAAVHVNLSTNRSEGYKGDIVAYSCIAENIGTEAINGLELLCGGNKTSTTYLTPGEKMHMSGVVRLQESTKIQASVKGTDVKGKEYIDNATAEIRVISPQMKLTASASPEKVHRGGEFSLLVTLENAGSGNLSNINLSDSLGMIGTIPALGPGQSRQLSRTSSLEQSISDDIRATALDAGGREIYSSAEVDLAIFKSGLNVTAEPAVSAAGSTGAVVYKGQPVDITWALTNSGEETIRNITLSTEGSSLCKLGEIAPGESVRIASTYSPESTSRINLTAQGTDAAGYGITASGSLLAQIISPGISLKVTPTEVDAAKSDVINVTCLMTNTGNDVLSDVVLKLNSQVVDSADRLVPGEFRVANPMFRASSSSDLRIQVRGADSLGRVWSDSSGIKVNLVDAGLKVKANSLPSKVLSGQNASIMCTVSNIGSAPLYNVFLISKEFGPLGTIDYIPPKQQRMVTSQKTVTKEVLDTVDAEGFTAAKQPLKASCQIQIKLLASVGSPNVRTPVATESSRSQNSNSDASGNDQPDDDNIRNYIAQQEQSSSAVYRSKAIYDSAEDGNEILNGLSGLMRNIERMLGQRNAQSDADVETSTTVDYAEPYQDPENSDAANNNYELGIESVKGSEHGGIRILDVSASPPQPSAGTPVKIMVHAASSQDVKSAGIEWGISESPLTKQDMSQVARGYRTTLKLESGSRKDGYWSCTIPGKEAGTYMVLSVNMEDGSNSAEDGPFMLHWSTIKQEAPSVPAGRSRSRSPEGMLFTESSSVKGHGEVSIKDSFDDSKIHYNERMKGYGSINMETLRSLDKSNPEVNFSQLRDLTFQDGHLQGDKNLESPYFHGGSGAMVSEKYSLDHVDKSETDLIRFVNFSDNTLAFNTDQAFNGSWNIRTQYDKFFNKIKGNQQYTGSFETEKKIKFSDIGQE